jgi:hypothetical protein
MVAPEKDYGIDYLPNGEYKTWKLTGYNTRLNRTEEHYIYARLTRNSDTAMILFSVNEYAIDGSIGGQNPSEYYYYIRIGKITATDKLEEATLDREITLDYGKLSTPAGQTQDTAGWKELFSVTADDLIRPLKKFTSYIVQGTLSIIGKLVINDKQISDVARQVDEGEFSASDELIPTTALLVGKYITKIREYFLSKDREDQTKFLLRLIGGAEFGTYASGISGAQISSDGAAELLNLLLRGALTIGDYQVKKSGAKIDEQGVADLLSILVRNGMESANFSTGALGTGFCLKKDENGDSYLEVDRMLVRKVATFIQLLIQQIKHVGGQIILTPASMSCVKVEDKGDFYRCYFENTDGEKTIEQEFVVGDLARAQTFNVKEGVNENVTNTYYWRAVVGTGDNYIDLSKTDCDAGSTEPKAGDDIVQLGNKSDATRQAAIILSAYGNDAPYFKLYRGINSYSLDGKEFVSFSRSEVMIIADAIKFSSGESVKDYIDNAVGEVNTKVDDAISDLSENISFVNQLSKDLEAVKNQIDGAIETWFYEPVPTLSNEPAVNWTTNEDKNVHLGDLYYDGNGKAYRFQMSGTSYVWQVITDSDITKALADAKKAQDTADGKRRVFVTTPSNASVYDIGDLWVNATYGSYKNDLLRCKTSKQANAQFSIEHWELATRYTDDTKANQAIEDAANAKAAADNAQTDANEAKERLDSWASDGSISPTEKQSLKEEISRIDADKTQIANGYAKYNLDTPTNYNNAHTAYRAVLVTLTASSPETITIPSDFATKQTAYYTQRTNALTAISNAARDYAQGIANDLNTYKQTVSSQFEQTNNSITAAVTSSKEYTNNAINNIQIGGRNYFAFSRTKIKNTSGTGKFDKSINGAVLTTGSNSTSKGIVRFNNFGLTDAGDYTLSCEIKATSDVTIKIDICDYTILNNIAVTNQYKKIKLTGRVAAYINGVGGYYGFVDFDEVSDIPDGVKIYIKNFKLESGNKATDWSPAPEDSENALTEYKKEVTAQFSVLEGEISSKVSSTEMTTIKQEILNSAATDAANKVNSIQVGGRNYALGTGTKKETTPNNSSNQLYNLYVLKKELGGNHIFVSAKVKFENCTFSSNSKASLQGNGAMFGWSPNYTFIAGGGQNKEYIVKWETDLQKPSSDNTAYIQLRLDYINGGKVTVSEFKAEIGNKATDWSPAPEDADSKYATITTVESMQTEITQLSSEISLRAYKSEVTAVQNNLNQTNNNLSALTTRVSKAEIALQPDNIWIGISSKVTTTTKVNNIVPDSCFDDANYSLLYGGGSRVSAATANNSCPTSYCMKSTQRDVQARNYVSVSEGEKYYISAYVNAQLANYTVRVGLILKKSDGSTTWMYNNDTSVASKTSGWQKISGYITIPAGYIKAGIWFQIDGGSNFGSAYFTKVYAYKVDESVNQNYALLTSNEKRLTTFNNVANQRNTLYKTSGLRKGDIVTISFEYEASNLIWDTTENSYFRVQFDDKFGWTAYNIPNLKSNGTGKIITPPLTLGGSDTNIKDSNIEMCFYYISSVLQDNKPIGYFRVWNMKVEKGERSTPWSAAPSDYSTTEEIKAGMQITDKGFNFFGQEFNFSGRISVGDLDPTIIENGYLRASLINADTLVVKTLNASNTDGVSTLVNKDGLKMTQGSNVLFKLTSNKSTVGTTRYYAQMDLTTAYSDGSTLQGTLTPESLFLRGKTKSTDKTLKTTLMYNGLMIYDENGTGLTVNTKGIQLTYCGKTQGGSNVCAVVHYAKCIFSVYITAQGRVSYNIGGSIPNSSGTPIEFSVTRTGAGRYKVTHNINDLRYMGQITALSNGNLTVGIFENRNSTSFEYSTISFNGSGWYAQDCGVYLSIYYESPKLFTF